MLIGVWVLLMRPPLAGGGASHITFTVSTSSSSETQTTTQTARVDTFATRIVAVDGIGGEVTDQTLPAPLTDGAVQAAVDTARTALFTGPPASLFVRGPTLIATVTELIDSSTETQETSRQTTDVVNIEEQIGPGCIGIGDRNVPNTTPCAACTGTTTVPPAGTPQCVPALNINYNGHTDYHTVIHELQTTTDTYRTTETYSLVGSFLDHFVLYKVKGTKTAPKFIPFGPVTLTDLLGGADYDVKKLPAIGLPANKNAEGVADATTHLAQYALKRRKTAGKFAKIPDVAVTNQCGGLTLTLAKPESLLVPVAEAQPQSPQPLDPASHEVDHFLCYKAKAQKKRSDGTSTTVLAKGSQVDAVDHFQIRRYDLKKVTRLCVPVTTAGTPAPLKDGTNGITFVPTVVRHPAGHLVCYQAKAASKTIPQDGCGPVDPKAKGTKIDPKQPKHQKQLLVQINGPLGASTVDTNKEAEICIPSTATFPIS